MKLLLAICLATLFVLGVHQHFAESGISGVLPVRNGGPGISNARASLKGAHLEISGGVMSPGGLCMTTDEPDGTQIDWCETGWRAPKPVNGMTLADDLVITDVDCPAPRVVDTANPGTLTREQECRHDEAEYKIKRSDGGILIRHSNKQPSNMTLPPESAGFSVDIVNEGVGTLTLKPVDGGQFVMGKNQGCAFSYTTERYVRSACIDGIDEDPRP